MNTRRVFAVGCAAMFCLAGVAWSAEPTVAPTPVRAALSQTGEASCLIKVTCDPTVLPLNRDIVEMLLKSAGVGNAAYRDLFGNEDFAFTLRFGHLASAGMPAAQGGWTGAPAGAVEGGMMGGGMGGMGGGGGGMGGMGGGGGGMGGMGGYGGGGMGGMGGMPNAVPYGHGAPPFGTNSVVGQLVVTVDLGQGAGEFMGFVCDRLRAALLQAHDAEAEQVRERAEAAASEVERARARLDELQNRRRELSAEAGQGDLAREAVLDRNRVLTQELQELEMRAAGERARREMIERQLSESGARSAQEAENDLMAKALEQKLAAMREKLENVRNMATAGQLPQQEVRDAETQVVMAEAALAERRNAAAREGGGGRLGRWNAELAELSIASAECEARLRVAREKAEKTKELLARADEYERSVVWELPLARRAYEQARLQQEELARWLRTLQPPSVTVIGGW